MNGLEERYSKWLDSLMWEKRIVSWLFEPMGLKLAEEKCLYHPDFLVIQLDHF